MKKIIIALLLHATSAHAIPSVEMGIELHKNEQFEDAIRCFEEIVENDCSNINAHFHLGCCYLAIGQGEKAIASFTRTLEISHCALAAQYNIAYTYKTMGNIDKAIELYKEIIATHPDYDAAQLGLGFAYITQGNFELGWEQHKRYLAQSGKNADCLRALLENDDICYKIVLLRPEGGLGDTINFIRYAQRLKEMGADIIVTCQKQLIPLLSRCTYIDQIIPSDQQMPTYHADATLMSLPAIFEDIDNTVPCEIPYIFPDPELVKHWQTQLAPDTNFKVGICWQADVFNDTSKLPIARRGYPLKSFTRLKDIPGVSFYSLQKHDGVEQIDTLPSDFQLRVFDNFDEKSGPFMDAAALIENLDLVITVDTAIAHLAGALGCKVWLLHPFATADWRWIHGNTDSYWYPTMHIFKQQKPFDYDGVMVDVQFALQELIAQQ